MTLPSVEELVAHFGLLPHPEGGYFRESYRCHETIPKKGLPSRFSGARNFSTAIYYLLQKGQKSRLHRIQADEVWHFYLGGPLAIVEIDEAGVVHTTKLGPDIKAGHVLQHVVAANRWFGAAPETESDYCFVGCTVAPGFNFLDFEMGDPAKIRAEFPKVTQAIVRFL